MKIPGYTGHQRGLEVVDERPNGPAQKKIPGYAGYIPSVASENVYGVTYSKATQSSAESTIHKGMDQPSSIKFRSTANAEFQQRHADNFESVSQTVGVRRQQDRYQAPVPPQAVCEFFGMNPTEGDHLVQQQHF